MRPAARLELGGVGRTKGQTVIEAPVAESSEKHSPLQKLTATKREADCQTREFCVAPGVAIVPFSPCATGFRNFRIMAS